MDQPLSQLLGQWQTSIMTGLVISTLLVILSYFFGASSSSRLPVLNAKGLFEFSDKRTKQNFAINGRRILREGLARFGRKPFKVWTDFGYATVLPVEYADEIRNIDDLSHARAIAKLVNAHYPGMDGFKEFAFGDDIVQDCIKLKLTQALGSITGALSEETSMMLSDCFTDSKEWHSFHPHAVLLQGVARVSSRLFLGEKLCRDPEWLKITTSYTYHVSRAISDLNSIPKFLRPLLYRFLPRIRELRRQVREAHRVMGRVLKEREAATAANKELEYVDAIEWFRQVAKGRKYDPVNVQLTLSFVAIHTTADTLTQLMFDLAEHPEYIQPLREEVIQELTKHGWKKSALYNMKLLDSLMKESQRLRPINDTSLQRIALKDVTLSDGTHLPRNTISVVESTRHWDSKYYVDPEKFDPYRFLNMRKEPGKESVAQFVSTGPNHLGFGHGQHACPGRFFASNEIKIIMCHILLKYDWRLVQGQPPPKIGIHGWMLVADSTSNLEIRRREEEISIDDC